MFIVSKKIVLKSAKNLKALFLDLIFPIECLDCGHAGVWLCQDCFREIKLRTFQYCLHCKKGSEFGRFCPDCRPHYFLNGVWIAGNYKKEIIARLVKNLKYNFIKDLSKVLGRLLALFMQSLLDRKNFLSGSRTIFSRFRESVIVPVPLHKKRLRWRGFNQSELLARELAGHFNLEFNSGELVRIKHRKPQTKLRGKERRDNIKGCFAWQGGSLSGRNIILVDDVATTGSTLNECAKILKENGAHQVWGLVVAHG